MNWVEAWRGKVIVLDDLEMWRVIEKALKNTFGLATELSSCPPISPPQVQLKRQ